MFKDTSALKIAVSLIAMLVAPRLSAQTPTNTASIAGTARNENGAPVQASLTAISGAFIQRTLSATNGAFQLNQLRDGVYVVCGSEVPTAPAKHSDADDQILNSCLWLDSAYPKFMVTAGQALSGVTVTLKRGRRVTVRVNDPGKLLSPKVGQHSGNELSLHISGPSAIAHRIPIVAEDALGRRHAIVIPYNLPHKLTVQSTAFTLKDQSNLLTSAAPVILQFAHGDPDKSLVVNVSPKGTK